MPASWGFDVSINDVPLFHPLDLWWMSDIKVIPDLVRDTQSVRIPGSNGEAPVFFETVQPTVISIQMKVNGLARTGRTLDANYQTLIGFVSQQTSLNIKRTIFGVPVQAAAKFVSAREFQRDEIGDEITCTLVFTIPGVFFRDIANSTSTFTYTELSPNATRTMTFALDSHKPARYMIDDGILRVSGINWSSLSLREPVSGQTLVYPANTANVMTRYLIDLATGRAISTTLDTWSMTALNATDRTAAMIASGGMSAIRVFRIMPSYVASQIVAGNMAEAASYSIGITFRIPQNATITVEYQGRRNHL